MNPLVVAPLVAVLILAGALTGVVLRRRLPAHHLDDDTKEMVKIGIGFLSTLAALVLGLIISSAKNSFDTVSRLVESGAAEVLQLDGELRELGAQAQPARQLLRQVVERSIVELWASAGQPPHDPGTAQAPLVGFHELKRMLRALTPQGPEQQSARSRALQLIDQLAGSRAVIIAHRASTITVPLLVVVVFWLVLISLGLNIFAPFHGTAHAVNVLCALSVAAAIFLMLEMDQPYEGIVHVSEGPLRAALARMQAD
ncbi:hypothetical protein [Accumulibacter sp.]|uniref:bestrophin-like domain n=1 Tax=Accumulibacter sp. TaxID=2053492 RepID=UPI0025FD9A31|nr:hypothetical protein [Accumulibacter sp.]MCM8626045.1 hypothetical protein [Accumulibacter sp.]